MINVQSEYDRDFYSWIVHNAALMRQGKFSEIDLENVVEELEGMARSEKRELINRLAVLIGHLLKWQFQPEKRRQGHSWQHTIKEQRRRLIKLLQESPSLKRVLKARLQEAYQDAIFNVLKETKYKLGEDIFPKVCPFSLEDCLNEEFFPNDEAL